MFVYYVYESLIDARLYETCDTCDTTVTQQLIVVVFPRRGLPLLLNPFVMLAL